MKYSLWISFFLYFHDDLTVIIYDGLLMSQLFYVSWQRKILSTCTVEKMTVD